MSTTTVFCLNLQKNLPGSDADKGEYLPNEHGTEQPAKEDLDVENNSVLPTTSGDNGQSPQRRWYSITCYRGD